jgi:hypothetical protein
VFGDIPEDLTKCLLSYGKDFSFVIFILKPGNHTYHPFGYMHPLLTDASLKPYLFIPTKHYHSESGIFGRFENGEFKGCKSVKTQNGLDGYADDWDHTIFTTHPKLDSTQNDGVSIVMLAFNRVPWNIFPAEFRPKFHEHLKRWTQKGRWHNEDIVLRVESPKFSSW